MTVNDNSKSNLNHFAKNDGDKKDPRINRRGRAIRKADDLTKAWQDIWSEIIIENGKPVIDEVTGKALTRLQVQMRAMTSSQDPRKIEIALNRSYGKVSDRVSLTGADGGPVQNETRIITVTITPDE